MPLGFPSRVLIAFAILITILPGCTLKQINDARWRAEDAEFNPWLGKSKDLRLKRIGPPEQCVRLSDGGEVCEWVVRGVSYSAGKGGTWERHIIFTYDGAGIAQEWNYRGTQGERSSRDSQSNVGTGDWEAKKTLKATSTTIRRSPNEIPYIGITLDTASRQRVHEVIISKGGRLLTQLHAP